MSRRPPLRDIDEAEIEVDGAESSAAGPVAVAVAMKRALEQMGPVRSARTLLRLNQVDGFDCQGCAWPDPDPSHRHTAEFCENGAKAVAEEATRRTVGPEFFAEHPMSELRERTDYWLGQQGRLTQPVVLRAGATHYEPIGWDDAFAMIGDRLRGLASPDEALFYTSGKTSNEAAFVYQLFARAFGTNNLPDCSNMCHESTSVALAEVIGIGKGSVTLNDVETAECLVIMGQNPGTNHPRMLSALEKAKQNGARIIAINPLREAGLVRFKNPQKPRGLAGPGTELADLHLPVRINGDLALLQAIAHHLLEWGAIDHDFVERHTHGFEEWVDHVRDLDWDAVDRATGLDRGQIRQAAEMLRDSSATVFCWAMGITQHRNAVATVKEIANLSFLQGNIGKPGAGLCPVRGHSNVQGDRTMGIWEQVPDHFLDSLQEEFGFEPPREHGLDTVNAVKALRDGDARVFFGMGGNFVSAVSDTSVTEDAMRSADLTVHVSTKLNRSHVVHGREALILPALGRSERDLTGGRPQRVTVEDSMSAVHASQGPLAPASDHLRSEVDIVCNLALATLGGDHVVPWATLRDDYTEIRRRIARVVPDCEAYDEKVDQPGGFVLPHPPRDTRTFPTEVGKARFTASPTDVLHVPEGRLLLQTMRSHDQFNTTIYGLDDRYRGVKGGRRVVFVHPEDIAALGLADGGYVDLVSEWDDGERRAPEFRVVAYDQPRGCAAAYYPETNPLIALDHVAEGSNCPSSKSVVVRLDPTEQGSTEAHYGSIRSDQGTRAGSPAGTGTKRSPEPDQLG
ncbi:FdhF/YdeP family oxidoreductase [Nocardioides euryhalodurans]|uniref:FdhF/YdeP family oxidoreductase n=1 Tax=Nocardioides euryhalodurans TaxID=2518370 RepID=A0A4P7GKJ0_9ACTN|nr:FdhF/YdeP family oxidoreductase [Nocardioides euryhalodurans]QBR92453.1 FdhF/YdeP family oxidoreductase [Nocardioides euryhalodurans]